MLSQICCSNEDLSTRYLRYTLHYDGTFICVKTIPVVNSSFKKGKQQKGLWANKKAWVAKCAAKKSLFGSMFDSCLGIFMFKELNNLDDNCSI